MICPKCFPDGLGPAMKCYNTRQEVGTLRRRYYLCAECGRRWSSWEELDKEINYKLSKTVRARIRNLDGHSTVKGDPHQCLSKVS